MRRFADWVVLSCGVVVWIGCGASQQSKPTETDRSVVEKMDSEWTPDEESWAEGESSDAKGFSDRVDIRDVRPEDSSRSSSSGGGTDEPADPSSSSKESGSYEMTYHDCNVLAGHYHTVIMKEELGKIPDGFNERQRAAAERSAQESARKGKAEWMDQCAGLVGTAYPRAWLKCGMKADTVKGFTDCVTGGKKK